MDIRLDQAEGELKAVIELLRKVYNDTVISYALFPQYRYEITHPDGYAKVSSECNDTMEIFIAVEDGRIKEASFMVEGCTTAVAAANAAISMIRGMFLRNVHSIGVEEILEELGGLPERDHHVAILAVDAIRASALDCERNVRDPWRKLYRRKRS